MRPSLKIGILTTTLAVLIWFILEIIALILNMHLRYKISTVLLIMAIVGVVIIIISYISRKIKLAQSKLKIALWIMLEMIMIIVIAFMTFVSLINMPSEKMVDDKLIIEYLDIQDNYETDIYNFIYYQ